MSGFEIGFEVVAIFWLLMTRVVLPIVIVIALLTWVGNLRKVPRKPGERFPPGW